MVLEDKEFETAEILELLIEFANGADLPVSNTWDFVWLMRFLVKWEMKPYTRFALLQLREWLRLDPDRSFFEAFWGAAIADDRETCAFALQFDGYTWSQDGPGRDGAMTENNHEDSSVWDSNSWGSTARSCLPLDYAWALGQAYCAVGPTSELAASFLGYLAQAKGESKFENSVPVAQVSK